MTEINYRLATESDLPVIVSYYEKLDDFFHEHGYNFPKLENVGQLWLESFQRTLGRYSIIFVAEIEGKVVGFMLGRVKRVPPYMGGMLVGEVSDMWIEPEARRLGIGEKLSELTIDWLREQKVHSVEARILEVNLPSTKLYTKMGFQPELRQYRLMLE